MDNEEKLQACASPANFACFQNFTSFFFFFLLFGKFESLLGNVKEGKQKKMNIKK